MRKILVIGIGTGNPDHVTVQAVKAMNTVDVFFFLDKGEEKAELGQLRKDIIARFVETPSHRIVEAQSPRRDVTSPDYKSGVDAWHAAKADIFEDLIIRELGEGDTGAFLVWGDPSLYDSTLRVIDQVLAHGKVAFDYAVIPGIMSIQALAASHRITLNAIGGAVHVTTGRRLADGLPAALSSTIVMLDDGSALQSLAADDLEIFWGAYLGTPDEILVSGQLSEKQQEIGRVRAEARSRKGWIMDTYLLRKPKRS